MKKFTYNVIFKYDATVEAENEEEAEVKLDEIIGDITYDGTLCNFCECELVSAIDIDNKKRQ